MGNEPGGEFDFIGAFAVYGYRKNPENVNQLLVDEYAAGIVKKIFAWKIAGLSNLAIAEKLDGMGILSPMEYKKSQGEKFSTGFVTHVKAKWHQRFLIEIRRQRIKVIIQCNEPHRKSREGFLNQPPGFNIIPSKSG